MNWRPWVIASVLVAVFITHGILLMEEKVATPETTAEMVDEIRDPLANIPFTASLRKSNLLAFGLTDELADEAAARAAEIVKDRKRLAERIKEDADVVGTALFAGGGLPQRYAALAFLVKEKDGLKAILPYDSFSEFEVDDWWGTSLARLVYDTLELTRDRAPDATAMGVAAILAGQESAALGGESPWGRGLGTRWSLAAVFKRHPAVQRQLVEYFAFMHVLVEIANSKDGICE